MWFSRCCERKLLSQWRKSHSCFIWRCPSEPSLYVERSSVHRTWENISKSREIYYKGLSLHIVSLGSKDWDEQKKNYFQILYSSYLNFFILHTLQWYRNTYSLCWKCFVFIWKKQEIIPNRHSILFTCSVHCIINGSPKIALYCLTCKEIYICQSVVWRYEEERREINNGFYPNSSNPKAIRNLFGG